MKKFISAILTIFIIISVIAIGWFSEGFRSWSKEDWKNVWNDTFNGDTMPEQDGGSVTDENGTVLSSDDINDMPAVINIKSSSLQLAEQGISVTIQAIVTPSTALNKAVDWSVRWAAEQDSEPVTNYVTVTPSYDGSNIATVTCLRSFSNNIEIVVRTRESGFEAVCLVKFVGIPTDMNISSNYSVKEYSVGNVYQLGIGDNSFTVNLNNYFNNVSATYSNYSVNIVGEGYLVLADVIKGSDGMTTAEDTVHVVSVDSLKTNFIEASFEGNVLKVKLTKNFGSYYGSYGGEQWLGHYKYVDQCITTSEDLYRVGTEEYMGVTFNDFCGFKIVITEQNSGLTETIRVNYSSTAVTGVSIGTDELLF